MQTQTLFNSSIRAGVWYAEMVGLADTKPMVTVTHQGIPLDNLVSQFDETRQAWQMRAELPAAAITDGIQTFVVRNAQDEMIGHFSIIVGDTTDGDLRAEVDLLRGELDILKAAFRRHCKEG